MDTWYQWVSTGKDKGTNGLGEWLNSLGVQDPANIKGSVFNEIPDPRDSKGYDFDYTIYVSAKGEEHPSPDVKWHVTTTNPNNTPCHPAFFLGLVHGSGGDTPLWLVRIR